MVPGHQQVQCWLQNHFFFNLLLISMGMSCRSPCLNGEILKNTAALQELTHWGPVKHICVNDLTSIGSDNGLSPGRHQAIIRTNAGILLIRPSGINFSEILIDILIFSFKKMRLKVSSAKRRPFYLGLNELINMSWWSFKLSDSALNWTGI